MKLIINMKLIMLHDNFYIVIYSLFMIKYDYLLKLNFDMNQYPFMN